MNDPDRLEMTHRASAGRPDNHHDLETEDSHPYKDMISYYLKSGMVHFGLSTTRKVCNKRDVLVSAYLHLSEDLLLGAVYPCHHLPSPVPSPHDRHSPPPGRHSHQSSLERQADQALLP